MAFNKKSKSVESKGSGSNISKEVWEAFNEHRVQVINQVTDDGENSQQVCFISGIVDSGTQKPQEEYTEYDWEDSERQHKLIEADFGCFHNEETNKLCIPNKSSDSVIFFVDFPDILIDYGMLFGEGEDLRPHRELLAQEWDNIATVTTLQPDEFKGYGPKSRIYKLAKATGCVVKGNPPADFDVGDLLGKVFTMDVIAEISEEGFFNSKISGVSSKHKAIPTPKHNITPFGIMMNEECDEEVLKFISSRKSVMNRLALAEEWNDSVLKEQITKLRAAKSAEEKDDDEKEPAQKAASKPKKVTPEKSSARESTAKKSTAKKIVPKKEEDEEEIDPFAED
jgi:hypothetical protein